jgi:hypothetical protein
MPLIAEEIELPIDVVCGGGLDRLAREEVRVEARRRRACT